MAGKLTAAAVKALVAKGKPGATADGGGLYLRVTAPGAGKWTLRYTLAGKAREMGLGSAADVSLAEARIKAEGIRPTLRDKRDPIAEREANARRAALEAAHTFADVAKTVSEARMDGWRNARHASEWLRSLERHAFPVIGAKPVAGITTEDVLAVLRPIWKQTPETASRVRQRLENVLESARVKGLRSGENPARWRGHLAELLAPKSKVRAVKHHPALPVDMVPAFMAELAKLGGMGAMALRFAILTAARSGEARKATWREMDLEAGIWTVPGERMKAGRLHRVPLSADAMALLRAIKPEGAKPDALVFPTVTGKVPSDMTLLAVVRRMNEPRPGEAADTPPRWTDHEGRPVVPHGFRASFKHWSLTRAYADHLSELALAHLDKNEVRAAYARDDLLEERRPMMEAWGGFCTRAPASVASLDAARAAKMGI